MGAGRERVDQRADRAGVTGRGDQAVEDPLGAVELLDPDRRMRGHGAAFDDRQRVALQQVGLAARSASASPCSTSPSARYASPITAVASSSTAGSADVASARARSAVATSACMSPVIMCETDASRNIAGGAPRVARADPLGLGDQQLVGDQRRAAAHLDVAGHALHVGGEQRVGREPRRLPEQPERVVGLARARRVGRRLEQPPCARLVVGRELRGAAKSRAAVACAPRPRASSAAPSSAAATSSSGATAHAARCHARSGLPTGAAAASAPWAARRSPALAAW